MEGSDPKEKLEGAYWQALKKNWMVWPLVQAINFRFVPVQGQVLVVNIVSLGEYLSFSPLAHDGAISGGGRMRNGCGLIFPCTGWNCYLSYINSQTK